MTSRERLEAAFAFREPDRVPIELHIEARAHAFPETARLVRFIETEADNMAWVGGVDWGFCGLDAAYAESLLEDRPGAYRRKRRVYQTAVGPFEAITRHFYPHVDSPDFHWERRYIHTLDDMARLAQAPRAARPFARSVWDAGVVKIGGRGLPVCGLFHPLGWLVRQADTEEVYGWLMAEPDILHGFLANATRQIVETIRAIGAAGVAPWFAVTAHEMLIPPWLGMAHFDEWVVPYDQAVNEAVHRIGGKVRAHCHGNCMAYLERMAAMGVDAIEPLEAPPYGDVDLKEAKRRVGGRLVLSGNIPSQDFNRLRPAEVRALVKQAIIAAAPGGGFSLRTTGGHANVTADLAPEVLKTVVANVEAYVEAGLEYGRYPIR
jgi:hypothetical protein